VDARCLSTLHIYKNNALLLRITQGLQMLENFLKGSIDGDVINHYLRLLAQRQVQLENQVEQLTTELRRGHLQAAELALVNAKDSDIPVPPLMVDTQVQPELMAQLENYLPAIFQGFWYTVSPNELMKITGTQEKPVIASPYSGPSYNEIVAIIEHIQSLPKQEQTVIATICQQLQQRYHHLQTHPVSRFWLKKMEAKGLSSPCVRIVVASNFKK
jgi:hypothetical protein